MTSSMTKKTLENGAFSIEMGSYMIIKRLILKKGHERT
jgi:hypothetical protein